ncbi:MAG: type IX secretion system membrane protein PorP/SprF [Saprospiraceae bacterium]|nr:type IX secretion system membrane protein PorP/SprF [Candidatus Vicinibacter affinis]MBK8641350.1 type IX secretion system membrane protein PorP/SprF [Candidatus Vicinibacter affinis]
MKSKLVLLFLFGVANLVQAQLIPVSYNLNNRELINVALPNTEKIKYPFNSSNELMLMHRSQWTGLDQGPRWSGLAYSQYLDDHAKTGGSLYYESFGAIRSFFFSGNYSYEININENNIISGGGILRYNLNQLNTGKTSIRNPGDPLLAENPSSSNLSFSPGICFTSIFPESDISFVLGGSFHNALTVGFSKEKLATPLKALVLHSSLIKFLSPGFKEVSSIEFGFVYRTYNYISDDIHLYGKYNWKGYLSMRPGIRFGTMQGFRFHAVHLDIGAPIGNLFNWNNLGVDLNYVFELPFTANSSAFGTTHEICLSSLF